MARFNTSKKLLWVFYVALFALMFLCNAMTIRLGDDFAYSYSWADGSRITNPLQIIPSMASHAHSMNGRLVAHGVAQFWLMLPDWVFDVVNSLVFAVQIPLIVELCRDKEKQQNNLLHMGIFCAMWLFELAFGQVNLWLDGSCNYLWSVVAGLLFILPYVNSFMNDEYRMKMPKVLFLLLAAAMGGWSESGSAAFIFMAGLLMALNHFWQKKPVSSILVVGIVLAVAGYISIYLSPAQANKGNTLSLMSFLRSTLNCFLRLSDIWVLVAAFVVLLALNIASGTDKKRLALAGVFFLGAMCANFILIFALFYPERVAISTTVMLITADAILMQSLFAQENYRIVGASILLLLVLAAPAQIMRGTKDIYDTYAVMKANEDYLYQCAEEGIMDVELPIVLPSTKYSGVKDQRYLSCIEAHTWPNGGMANYYGVGSIIGIKPEYILP